MGGGGGGRVRWGMNFINFFFLFSPVFYSDLSPFLCCLTCVILRHPCSREIFVGYFLSRGESFDMLGEKWVGVK